jgi:cytochrome c553
MTDAAAVKAFISKWEQNTQKESAAAKEHFAELCRLIGVPTPNDPGAGPDTYCFEKSLTKTGGKAGFADVWKKDRFAWEYKGKQKSATCAACHGPDGNSVAPDFPRLAGQHYDYLVQAIAGYKSGARKSPVMAPMVEKLSRRDIEDLAAYFSQQKGLAVK